MLCICHYQFILAGAQNIFCSRCTKPAGISSTLETIYKNLDINNQKKNYALARELGINYGIHTITWMEPPLVETGMLNFL